MTDISLNEARVEDRALITATLHRYCAMATDNADFAGMAAVYTPDAVIRFPDGVTVGATEMAGVVKGNEPNFIRHHATTLDIRFRDENTADTILQYIAITDQAAPDHWGSWRDVLRKQEDGSWKIAERSIGADGFAPGSWAAATYGA